jgi:hypothetical protein
VARHELKRYRGRRGPAVTGYVTFVVRLTRDQAGHVAGVVERVKTGQKARVDRLEANGQVIAGLLAAARAREGSQRGERLQDWGPVGERGFCHPHRHDPHAW